MSTSNLHPIPHVKRDTTIGRIVSITGSKAVVILDHQKYRDPEFADIRPEMGTLVAIDTLSTISLGVVSALSVPMPGHSEDDPEVWIAELGLVGELRKNDDMSIGSFNRGISAYPALGDPARVANHQELRAAFLDPTKSTVTVGTLRQDASIPATIKTDELLGKHFAILGTTGTGKSCTTALILRAIIEENPQGHIILLDPHNEYSTAFKEWGEVITPHNMQIPYWLLTFEEIVEILLGDASEHKFELELLQELIPLAKERYGVSRSRGVSSLKKSSLNSGKYTVDTPVPYLMSDILQILDERMGMLENKKDVSPYRQLKIRIEGVIYDARYAFMFGNMTVTDDMAEVLGRIFRVPVQGKPITIMEMTGLPEEVVAVVVSVLCRMTFDFAMWAGGKVPVTLVCEEAHRYVPAKAGNAFDPARRAIARIAKEGRKYGASLCIVTQRPAEIDPTILSQCNTVFALRMANDRDQEIVQSAIADTGSGLLEFLPALGAREAIAFGDGVTLPVRIKFKELEKINLPRSSTAEFSKKWQNGVDEVGFLDNIVERWRTSGASDFTSGSEGGDAPYNAPYNGVDDGATHNQHAEQSHLQPALQPALQQAHDAPSGNEDRRLLRRRVDDRIAPQDAHQGEPTLRRPSLRREINSENPATPSTRTSLLRKPLSETLGAERPSLRKRITDPTGGNNKPVFK